MAPPNKICERHDVVARAAQLPRPLVFTNGVFDLLHRGHVEYLSAARDLGGALLVAINGDESARSLNKGPSRPLNCAADRATVLAALECVCLVVVFDELRPWRLLHEVRPQLYVKGGDYRLEDLVETRLVRQWEGRAILLNYRQGCSTSELIRRAGLATLT